MTSILGRGAKSGQIRGCRCLRSAQPSLSPDQNARVYASGRAPARGVVTPASAAWRLTGPTGTRRGGLVVTPVRAAWRLTDRRLATLSSSAASDLHRRAMHPAALRHMPRDLRVRPQLVFRPGLTFIGGEGVVGEFV